MGYSSKKHAKTVGQIEQISLERMHRLFELAEYEFEKHPERSQRYVQLAQKIGTRNKVKIPFELKKQFCKNCGSFLKIGKNGKLRVKGTALKITCNECKSTRMLRLEGQ